MPELRVLGLFDHHGVRRHQHRLPADQQVSGPYCVHLLMDEGIDLMPVRPAEGRVHRKVRDVIEHRSGVTLVKRVIAGPGQVAACCTDGGAVTVDGVPLDEPYVFEDFPFEPGTLDCTSTPRSARCFDSVTVPADSYLMLGDHRSASSDSAARCRVADADQDCWRWASRDDIVGVASAIIWPIGRWGGL